MSDRAPMLKPADLDVFLVAVEPSADVLGTGLMTALRATHKGSASFRGLGGAGMVQAGLATTGDIAGETHGQSGMANLFVGSNDEHLTAHTTTGVNMGSPFDVDPDGVSRTASGIWDRGAFEWPGLPPLCIRIGR